MGIVTGMAYRGRLAPSSTGLLHLGHARTFLLAAERAAAAGGLLYLRIDDLDRQRSRPEYVKAILEDLHWLGIDWTPWSADSQPGGVYHQGSQGERYLAAFQRLVAVGAVYPCTCSRRDLLAALHAPHAEDEDEPVYPGTCRPAAAPHGRQPTPPSGPGAAWRFRVQDGESVCFHDGFAGPTTFTAGRDFGDFVVMRRDGVPSYQLASVVDDGAMGITEVVRGRDLLRSTARQVLLCRALGYTPPAYAHCDLVVNEAGHRLAKRDGARSIRHLREIGHSAPDVRAAALGSTVTGGVYRP